MSVRLRPITLAECLTVGEWRSAPDVAPMLRTGPKTAQQQADFYREIVMAPQSEHRYWAIDAGGRFIGIGGLTYLKRKVGQAEISLVLGPDWRGKGYGSAAVDALYWHGWHAMGLTSIVGECYPTGAVGFWKKQTERLKPCEVEPQLDGGFVWAWVRP